MDTTEDVWALVLAAGEGSRLQGLTVTPSGVHVPKQFWSLLGGPSLLNEALGRARSIALRERMCTIVASQHQCWWDEPLKSLPESNVIVQPANRGTAHGILLPLLQILERDPDAQLVLLPADHYVRDESTLQQSLRAAVARLASCPGEILLLGIEAEEPDADLGYIVPGEEGGDGVFEIAQFVEKPSATHARALIDRGALWNAFIVAATARDLLALIEPRIPDVVDEMRRVVRIVLADRMDATSLAELYGRLPNLDFSRHVLEKGSRDKLRVLPVPACGWSDLGTPDRLAATLRRIPAHALPATPRSFQGAQLSLAAVTLRDTRHPSRPWKAAPELNG